MRLTDIVLNVLLFFLVWLSWGGSWLAIKWQTGVTPTPQSIAFRFALAAIILIGVLSLLKRLQPARLRDHGFFVLQGGCLYSLNFIAFYTATTLISSGLVAVVMSTVTVMNAIHGRIILQQRAQRHFGLSVSLGITGLCLLFWHDIIADGDNLATLAGIGYSLLGSWFFSMGNMISIRHTRTGVDNLTSNAWSMLYGCLIMLSVNFASGAQWVFDTDPRYIGSLLYLALIASVFAFPAYLLLVKRVGASSAAYVLVSTPVLALILSSFFEGYQWSVTAVTGVAVILLGNVVLLKPSGIFRISKKDA